MPQPGGLDQPGKLACRHQDPYHSAKRRCEPRATLNSQRQGPGGKLGARKSAWLIDKVLAGIGAPDRNGNSEHFQMLSRPCHTRLQKEDASRSLARNAPGAMRAPGLKLRLAENGCWHREASPIQVSHHYGSRHADARFLTMRVMSPCGTKRTCSIRHCDVRNWPIPNIPKDFRRPTAADNGDQVATLSGELRERARPVGVGASWLSFATCLRGLLPNLSGWCPFAPRTWIERPSK